MLLDSASSLSNGCMTSKLTQETVSKNLSFEVDYSAQRDLEVKHISFQLQDQHSSSTESTGLSHQEQTAMGKTSSQDQCASSDSVHDDSYGKHGQDMKAAMFLCNPELSINASQPEISQPIVHFPYAYSDPYLSGLFTPYGPHNMVMASASGRVPLPADLPEDGPIYVNAKQYHGILRRRQTRAKLEAQNKLVKTRKPYLHESRHQHALNRVRGSGGRFLSTKKSQQPESLPPSQTTPDSFHFGNMLNSSEHRFEANKHDTAPTTSRVPDSDSILQQPDGRFPSLPSHMAVPMQGSGSLVYNGNRHYASIVR
ncbi:nuclear transcription factor Y subunit A-3 isoform X3 [Sesamum indicum]|uniref:Nuclear transcription factor Y subunit n=1 Tax=Sesamum indicum TaxID=4182 RepID=A0A8M8VBQ7_SESIN|nr:nuclear transcription factor Y subunit A-3 isoform X3 [Sesamum indicum]